MAAKLSDVAKKAGCSVTTVSRVINNHGYLSQKTKDKVFAAMRELNYRPNSIARSLQGKKKNANICACFRLIKLMALSLVRTI